MFLVSLSINRYFFDILMIAKYKYHLVHAMTASEGKAVVQVLMRSRRRLALLTHLFPIKGSHLGLRTKRRESLKSTFLQIQEKGFVMNTIQKTLKTPTPSLGQPSLT